MSTLRRACIRQIAKPHMIKYFLRILRGEDIEDIAADDPTRNANSLTAGAATRNSPNTTNVVALTPEPRKPMHRVCELTVASLLEVSRLFKSAGQHFSELGAIEVLVELATKQIGQDKHRHHHHHHHHHHAVHASAAADGNSSEGSYDYSTDGSDASQVKPSFPALSDEQTLCPCRLYFSHETLYSLPSLAPYATQFDDGQHHHGRAPPVKPEDLDDEDRARRNCSVLAVSTLCALTALG